MIDQALPKEDAYRKWLTEKRCGGSESQPALSRPPHGNIPWCSLSRNTASADYWAETHAESTATRLDVALALENGVGLGLGFGLGLGLGLGVGLGLGHTAGITGCGPLCTGLG